MEGYKISIEKPMVLYIKTEQCERVAFTITFKRKNTWKNLIMVKDLYNEN